MQTEKSAIVLALLVLFDQKCPIQHWLWGRAVEKVLFPMLGQGLPMVPRVQAVSKGVPVYLHSCNIKGQAGGGFHSLKKSIYFTPEGEALGGSLQSWPEWAVVVGEGSKQGSYRLQVCFCTAGTVQQNVLLSAGLPSSFLFSWDKFFHEGPYSCRK